jgi:hypothetical protein
MYNTFSAVSPAILPLLEAFVGVLCLNSTSVFCIYSLILVMLHVFPLNTALSFGNRLKLWSMKGRGQQSYLLKLLSSVLRHHVVMW